MKQISELELDKRSSELLELWKENCRVYVVSNKKGKVLKWDDVLGSSPKNREIAEMLYRDHYLDIRLPYDFFVALNEARFRYFLSPEEQLALSHEMQGETDPYAHRKNVSLPVVKSRIRKELGGMVTFLRGSLELTTTLNKKKILLAMNSKAE